MTRARSDSIGLAGATLRFAGAAAMTGRLQGLLYHVTPLDGITWIAL